MQDDVKYSMTGVHSKDISKVTSVSTNQTKGTAGLSCRSRRYLRPVVRPMTEDQNDARKTTQGYKAAYAEDSSGGSVP